MHDLSWNCGKESGTEANLVSLYSIPPLTCVALLKLGESQYCKNRWSLKLITKDHRELPRSGLIVSPNPI